MPGDGAYAPNDEDIETQTAQICITPAPKLKPFQFESVIDVPEHSSNGNTLSPSTIQATTDPMCSSNNLQTPTAADSDGREGESVTILYTYSAGWGDSAPTINIFVYRIEIRTK